MLDQVRRRSCNHRVSGAVTTASFACAALSSDGTKIHQELLQVCPAVVTAVLLAGRLVESQGRTKRSIVDRIDRSGLFRHRINQEQSTKNSPECAADETVRRTAV